jgi:hypothetical protein
MKNEFLFDKTLKQWIGYEVDAAMAADDELKKRKAVIDALSEFVSRGLAERHIRRDGKIAWRATQLFLEQIREAEAESDEYDECI